MAVIRVNKTRDYTVMSNAHFREKNMSLKAKGLLSLMFSLPDDWNYSVEGLVAICKENKTAIQNTLSELESFGYLRRTRSQNKAGRFEYIYDIYEFPITETPLTEKPCTENLFTDNPCTDNQPQLNTNISNTNISNTKKEKTNNKYNIEVEEIVAYLNEKLGTKYRANSKDTQKHIIARLSEKFTVDDFKAVIDKKCADWIGTDWEQYLRPATLFGTKFENYLNAKSKKQNIPDQKPKSETDVAFASLFGD